MRRGSAIKYHAQRVAWVLEHRELMAGVPSMDQDVDDEGRVKLVALELALLGAGLLGGTQTVRRETVRRMVGELRDGKTVAPVW